MNKSLKKLNLISFREADEFYECLQKLRKKQKIGNLWSLKKMLWSYDHLAVFFFQQYFLNFLSKNEILSENFDDFKLHYCHRNFHNFASLLGGFSCIYVITTKNIFLQIL